MVFDRFLTRADNSASECLVGLDIGTEYVKALLARVNGEEIEIIGVGRKHQDRSDMHSGAIADIAAVVRNCEDALAQAESEAGIQARRAVIGIAGELVKGVTNTIRYRRPQPDRPLDETEMEFIIEKVQDRAAIKAQRQIALETGNQDVEVKLVNSALVSIHIDGYKVSNPISFQGKDVAVQIYTAFAPMVHIGALERVADELALDLVAVAAEPFAVSRSVLGTDANSSFTAILADVGGANECAISYSEAEKLKVATNHEQMKQELKQHFDTAIDKTLDVWLAGVDLALSEFSSVDHLPNRILLCGGGASLKPLVKALEMRDWYTDLPFTRRPVVQHIKPSDVSGVVDLTNKVSDHSFITAMGLLRVGYDTMIGASETETLRNKLNKMLRI